MAEQRINLNTATVEELVQLPGIGSVLAERIVTYRDTVHPYDEPAGIMAVSGIGEQSYRAIADRLTAAPPSGMEGSAAAPVEASPATPGASSDQAEEEDVTSEMVAEEGAQPEPRSVSEEEEAALEEEAEPEVEAIPSGESFADEGLPLEEEAAAGPEEEVAEDVPPEAEEASVEAAEEVGPGIGQEPVEEEMASEAAAGPGEGPPKEEPAEEEPMEGLPPASFAPPPERVPSRSWWRRLSWLWTAFLGGLLGLIFAMIVFAGVNGSLDVGHSRAVLGIKSDVSGLTADLGALETDVEGLRKRLEALEGLTARMEKVESSVDDLRDETSELRERTDAVEGELAAISEELQALSEEMTTLQGQVERAESFFSGLQTLLKDVFGEVESEPTPEGK